MTPIQSFIFLAVVVFAVAPARARSQAGPPFQTDDPTPLDLGHYEAYVFGSVDGTPVEVDSSGPAFEFNWGALPNIQLHAILPFGTAVPLNNPTAAPSGEGPSSFGRGDMELGVKYGFIHQTAHRPQIGSFTMFEIPTGDADHGLGLGRVSYKLPLWAEKEIGPWSICGGMGYAIVPKADYRNYLYGGFLSKREINKTLEMSAEIFSHGAQGAATAQTRPSTLLDAGGYYHFKSPGWQLLFAYGHSIFGQTENYGYLGLYRTWGKAGSTD